MAEPILDKASYSLVRTNPKLTGNVKLVTNGNDLYLESFSANTELSSSSFKAFKVDGSLTYDQDVFNFFKKGKFPIDLAYEVFQEFRDVSVLSSYANQYEMFYSYGTRSISSESYSEDLGILAPIWLNEQIPNYFVIFRLDDPVAVNNINASVSEEGQTLAQSAEKFSQFVLEKCTAIKTFDLSETSVLGGYLRRYKSQELFPKAPMTVSWRKDEPILWNGISYYNGGFTSAGNFSYDSLITKDSTILQNEHFFTQGFQRNGIILANLINLEFLFSDTLANDYSINRYFGLYVDEINEGNFKLSGEGFYKGIEKTQFPSIRTINEVSEFLNTKFEINNKNGVLLYLDGSSINTTTGIPTPNRVNEVESVFYVKDKTNQFHTIKKGSVWSNNQLRLFDTKIDVSLLSGFNSSSVFAEAKVLDRLGKPTAFLEVIGEFPDGSSITFYNGSTVIGQVSANEELTNGPGTYFQAFFNPKGTPAEIANAIVNSIKVGININNQFFVPSINGSTVYLQSRFAGTNSKQLKFKLNWIEYPELEDSVKTYPVTNESNETANFVGGTNKNGCLLKIRSGDQDRFIKGGYVRTKAGFAKISDWIPYLDEPVISGNGTQIGYTDINEYVIISTEDNQIDVSRSGQVSLYTAFLPSFGRFSFFPIKDFDFDFYSEKYSRLGELSKEENYYTVDSPIGQWPDVRDFYGESGFFNLIGLLKDSDLSDPSNPNINSEYKRLEENFLKEQATASRITPYINKWVWYDGGTDVRNNPYRLNVNLAFGINNFAPSKWNSGRSSDGFSHEWYYLSQFPHYFNKNAIESSWSYFDKIPVDNIEEDDTFQPGTFQRVDQNMFDEYFIVDRFDWDDDITLIDRQLRFGRFTGGNSQNFAEAFLRGVRIIAKTKTSGEEKSNFNAKRLSYLRDGRFNDYRFSVMLIPNAADKPKNQIKIVKNDKWKTVVMLIFISFKNECLNPTENSVDRTSLYAINSNIEVTEDCETLEESGYKDSLMQGSISLSSSGWSSAFNQWLIQGTTDLNGVRPSFFTDITVGKDGQFNSIEFEIDGDEYKISSISKVLSANTLLAGSVTKNGTPLSLPTPVPISFKLRSAVYVVKGGGFNQYSSTLNNVSFANIFNMINEGDPSIIYETIDSNGNQVLNSDGTLAQTFSIELRAQDDILKSSYVGVLPDQNKPTIFNLIDIIGYDLSLQTKPKIIPIARHSGWYTPLANDVIFFRDPYANINLEDVPTGTSDIDYKTKVFNLCRYKNTQFYSGHINFGMLNNFFYHKVNEEDPSSILELSTNSAFLSLYPLINESGIDYKKYYMFSSNWDPGYFVKSIDKIKKESIIGTRSMVEKKSFFASKYLKVPQEIILDTFSPSPFNQDALKTTDLVDGTFMYNETSEYVEFYLLIQKRLTAYLAEYIKPTFIKYINPQFGFGRTTSIDDDVNEYIKQNVLSLYKINTVDFYVKSTRENTQTIYTSAELTNVDKVKEGLKIDNVVSSKTLNTNLFDLKLIYNKTSGFSNSFGFSISIVKK
jgi:hypothetical protein